ncbi:hypothetical protein BDQ17DRAFT_1431445 [Cyathus striatus]|nr:hypothetical protein BDQ17DRAFT_1431445 [Cyathus striatus]
MSYSYIPVAGTVNSTSTYNAMDECLAYYNAQQDVVVRPWVYGNLFSGVIYGAIAILYLAYLQLVRKQYPKFDVLTRQAWMLMGYATVTFILCTMTFTAALKKSVDLLNLPNCSWSDLALEQMSHIQGGLGTMGNICFMLTSWTADALLIWRCLIIYHDIGNLKWVYVSVPILLEVASIVFGSIFCKSISSDPNDVFRPMIYYESITLALNALLTILIISRLFVLRYRVRKTLGPYFGDEYTSVAAMLTESQAMTLVSQGFMVALIVLVGDNGGTLVVYQVLSQVQALAPMLIIYRVMQGKAWSNTTIAQITKTCSFGTVV